MEGNDFVFTLSHGKNQVECGSSIIDDLIVQNLKAESIGAQHIVHSI